MTRSDRPNLLVIMTDQQSAHMLSGVGTSHVSTPNLDALAQRGVRFERAYCTNPICTPSRTSIWTGRMPHETGVMFNLDRHDVMVPCVGRTLTDAGYDCHFVGKWHVPMTLDNTAWHGFRTMAHTHEHHSDPHVVPTCDALFAQPRDQPFFIVASFHNPHDICQFARGDKLPNGDLPPPPPVAECPPLPANHLPPAGEPQVIRELQRSHRRTYPSVDYHGDDWRRYRWAYSRLVERVDAQIGQLLASLDANGVGDSTAILFFSDHGDGDGSHQWNQKTLFYDEIARIPMFVVPPGGIAGRVDRESLVSIGLDVVPTLCGFAGVAPPTGCKGIDLGAAVRNGSTLGREAVVAQNNLAPEYGVDGGVYGRMYRTSQYKYIAFSRGVKREQLFDLERDPGEMHDLIAQPEHQERAAQLRTALATWCSEHKDPFLVPGVEVDGWWLQRDRSVE